MKEYIEHLWHTQRRSIVENSVGHCHVFGMHSVMLCPAKGHIIRLFVADWDHELWRNTLCRVAGEPAQEMSIAIHPHHCSLTLHTVFGEFTNRVLMKADDLLFRASNPLYFKQFLYDSKLAGGSGGFTYQRETPLALVDSTKVKAGSSVFMPADRLHTVSVPRRERAAWLVYEGPDDPNYVPVCYSNADLSTYKPDGLYQPATEPDVRLWLRIAGFNV